MQGTPTPCLGGRLEPLGSVVGARNVLGAAFCQHDWGLRARTEQRASERRLLVWGACVHGGMATRQRQRAPGEPLKGAGLSREGPL